MTKKVDFNEASHNALTTLITTVSDKFAEVKTSAESLNSEISSNFSGEGATALNTALTQLVSETETAIENWKSVKTSADSIAESIKNADASSKATVENGGGS